MKQTPPDLIPLHMGCLPRSACVPLGRSPYFFIYHLKWWYQCSSAWQREVGKQAGSSENRDTTVMTAVLASTGDRGIIWLLQASEGFVQRLCTSLCLLTT